MITPQKENKKRPLLIIAILVGVLLLGIVFILYLNWQSKNNNITSSKNVLENCLHWFDGCNDCFITVSKITTGKITTCTEQVCDPDKYKEPKCYKYKVENDNQSKYSCQQDSDCVLVQQGNGAYGCCPSCDMKAVYIREKNSAEEQIRNNCLIDAICPLVSCPTNTFKAVCEQNRCVAKEISAVDNPKALSVLIDKETYQKGEPVNINIQNNTKDNPAYHATYGRVIMTQH